MNTNREECELVTLLHASGAKFNVFLNKYEIKECEEGGEIGKQICEKYYKLFQNGLLMTSNTSSMDEIETENLPTSIDSDAEEQLIVFVSQRPPLYNFRLPLVERSKSIIRRLWEEVIADMNVNMTVEEISKKWKNIRDSYIRARANVNKKICSGSSANEKIAADKIREKHKNYELLKFLDDTLVIRPTSSNLNSNEEILDPSASSSSSRTPSRSSSRGENIITEADKEFLETIKTVSQENRNISATEHFCLRLADSLERLPRHVRNNLELEILQKVNDVEREYVCD